MDRENVERCSFEVEEENPLWLCFVRYFCLTIQGFFQCVLAFNREESIDDGRVKASYLYINCKQLVKVHRVFINYSVVKP